MIKGLHHIHLFCSDVEKSARFFKDSFNAEELYRGELSGRPFIRIGLSGLVINLTGMGPNAGQLDPGNGKYGLDHFSLQVDNIEEAAKQMRDKGITVLSGPDLLNTGSKVLFIEGPDGIQIELLELKKTN